MAERDKNGLELGLLDRDISGHNSSRIALNRLIFKPEGELW